MVRQNFQFSRSDYKDALADYQNNWELIDDVLRKLCRDHPNHVDRGEVNAKVQIIGLSYSTGIQRLIAPHGNGPGRAIYQVAEHIFDQREEVDQLVAMVCAIRGPLTLQALCTIVHVHGRFVELLQEITRTGGRTETHLKARSFVSKYLHFHRSIVPIYDSYAAEVLTTLMPLAQCETPDNPPEHADSVYYEHALRFFGLYSEIRSACLPISVKYVDAYLLWLASYPEPELQGVDLPI
jgi:hypothetical protein